MLSDNFMWFPGDSSAGGGSNNTVESTLKNGSKVTVSVSGETTDEWFKLRKAFEVKNFSFAIEASELRNEQAQFKGITITKIVDTASVGLFKACSLGARFPTAMLALREPGGDNLLYLQYMFRDVGVKSISWDGGSGSERPSEKVTFEFSAMGLQYIQQNSVGRMANTFRWSWNTLTDKPSLDIPDLGPAPEYLSAVQTVAPAKK